MINNSDDGDIRRFIKKMMIVEEPHASTQSMAFEKAFRLVVRFCEHLPRPLGVDYASRSREYTIYKHQLGAFDKGYAAIKGAVSQLFTTLRDYNKRGEFAPPSLLDRVLFPSSVDIFARRITDERNKRLFHIYTMAQNAIFVPCDYERYRASKPAVIKSKPPINVEVEIKNASRQTFKVGDKISFVKNGRDKIGAVMRVNADSIDVSSSTVGRGRPSKLFFTALASHHVKVL